MNKRLPSPAQTNMILRGNFVCNLKVIRVCGKERKCSNCLCISCINNMAINDEAKCDGCSFCFSDDLEPIRDINDPKCIFRYTNY